QDIVVPEAAAQGLPREIFLGCADQSGTDDEGIKPPVARYMRHGGRPFGVVNRLPLPAAVAATHQSGLSRRIKNSHILTGRGERDDARWRRRHPCPGMAAIRAALQIAKDAEHDVWVGLADIHLMKIDRSIHAARDLLPRSAAVL